MRYPRIHLATILLLWTGLTTSTDVFPFGEPYAYLQANLTSPSSFSDNDEPGIALDDGLVRRATSSECPGSAVACTAISGGSNACCAANQNCALDDEGHVACCPVGAYCTGAISVATGTSSSSVLVLGGTTTTSGPASTSATTTVAISPASTMTGSTVSNGYFPFVYAATTFANEGACSTAYSSCQSEYSSCTASLGGGINGVTVSGAGVGITVEGTTGTLGAAAASSVCSSLSSEACHGLQLASCTAYGTAGMVLITPSAASSTRSSIGWIGVGLGLAMGAAGFVFVS